MISLWLEHIPPSVNANTRFGKGWAYSSPRYKAWKEEADEAFREQSNGATITGPFRISITAVRPDARKRDLDNLIKPILDAVQRAGIIENDCHCDLISARWVTTGDGVAVRLEKVGVE